MMTVMPHNHWMWAVIGIYRGREDNIFWRRVPGIPGKVEATGAKALSVGEAEALGHNIIHSVINPIPRLTGALHVYGGDFFNPARRSERDPETLMEQPFDPDRAARRFEDSTSSSQWTAI
jgi:predicted metal-dependent enzyme (double-stranded beta helix superfamily)